MSSVLDGLNTELSVFKEFREYFKENEDALLGYVMSLGYEDGTVITNDFFKVRNQGIPKNSFVIIKLIETRIGENIEIPEHYILARVKEPTSTPLANDVSRTYFELHKNHMPEIDIFTRAELQWSALKITVLGTYYENDKGELEYAGDIESYYSPHLYEVFRASDDILYKLINHSIDNESSFVIGKLRYTESKLHQAVDVDVKVSAKDFVAARTALFGKTRMGKSNTVKIIAESILENYENVGQLIFDLNGEYANVNEQDNTSLYDKYQDRCERYSVNPKGNMSTLKVNVYEDLKLGHEIIKHLMQMDNIKADYLNGFLNFEVLDKKEINDLRQEDFGRYNRYQRHESIYKCILYKAGFKITGSHQVNFNFNKDILETVFGANYPDKKKVKIEDAVDYYQKIWDKYCEIKDNPPFTSGKEKKNYFNETDISLLSILTGKKNNGANVSGTQKIMNYKIYHDGNAKDALSTILHHLDNGKTVILDLSNSNPVIVNFFSEKICNSVFSMQMEAFTNNNLKDKYVQFYFEEAHNLFPSNDNDLTNIYNRLAKEGAKLNIGIVYSTQSITSLSRDLLKNTENFFIAHLNDSNEIKELTKFYEFKDVGIDIQKTKSKGFVRMTTKSHMYALPVQIKLFGV
ncbi:hypothetical protein F4694_005672 [Bacillus niacini]|uniref:Helicase HerA central domain-containing protein n=1 Tax=Neobacillus niacini TaxID=86668 RepID=A0A852TMA0_9BACI|nr:DUF87 domain-containing protein [Neobacillus niacini]NYE08816.1 hypothetical protein [Neobacillus niacini]